MATVTMSLGTVDYVKLGKKDNFLKKMIKVDIYATIEHFKNSQGTYNEFDRSIYTNEHKIVYRTVYKKKNYNLGEDIYTIALDNQKFGVWKLTDLIKLEEKAIDMFNSAVQSLNKVS